MGLDDLIPVVPEYLQEESSQEENLDQENDVEEQEIEQDSVDYSLYLEDILSNQETIISNQEALLLDNQNFEHHYQLYDNAFKAMTNILVISIIFISAFWICKNIFIKMM